MVSPTLQPYSAGSCIIYGSGQQSKAHGLAACFPVLPEHNTRVHLCLLNGWLYVTTSAELSSCDRHTASMPKESLRLLTASGALLQTDPQAKAKKWWKFRLNIWVWSFRRSFYPVLIFYLGSCSRQASVWHCPTYLTDPLSTELHSSCGRLPSHTHSRSYRRPWLQGLLKHLRGQTAEILWLYSAV